jgi:hypothetical protein
MADGKKQMISVYVTPEQRERLRKLHEATRVPMAVLIREGLDLLLDKYKGKIRRPRTS